jgi:hypothetical protein
MNAIVGETIGIYFSASAWIISQNWPQLPAQAQGQARITFSSEFLPIELVGVENPVITSASGHSYHLVQTIPEPNTLVSFTLLSIAAVLLANRVRTMPVSS